MLSRLWRGVTDTHLIEEKFLESAEARKLHKVAAENLDAYESAAKLVKPSAVEDAPEQRG